MYHPANLAYIVNPSCTTALLAYTANTNKILYETAHIAHTVNPSIYQPAHLVHAVKGTVSRDFLTLVFFIKHLLLVPLDMPRKDFKFFRIFEELFEFVIDSPVYSLPVSRDSPVYSSPGSRDSPVFSSLGS